MDRTLTTLPSLYAIQHPRLLLPRPRTDEQALAAQQDIYPHLFQPISRHLASFGGFSALSQRADRDGFSLPRFIMEQLIFRNLYGFLVSDIEAPVLMQDEDVPLFEEAVRWSRRDEDWESFERMFGMSGIYVEVDVDCMPWAESSCSWRGTPLESLAGRGMCTG